MRPLSMVALLGALLAVSASAPAPQTRPALRSKSAEKALALRGGDGLTTYYGTIPTPSTFFTTLANLRGGSIDTYEGTILAIFGSLTLIMGLGLIATPERVVPLLVPGFYLGADREVLRIMGAMSVAWGLAHFSAIRESIEREFSQLNVIPVLAMCGIVAPLSWPAGVVQAILAGFYFTLGFEDRFSFDVGYALSAGGFLAAAIASSRFGNLSAAWLMGAISVAVASRVMDDSDRRRFRSRDRIRRSRRYDRY